MHRRYVLEISVETVDAAMAAERGGAHRIELCSNLLEGGVSPSAELMRAVRECVCVPIFAMVRPRGGNFVYSDDEFAAMQRAIDIAKQLGIDGAVLGLLKIDGQIDGERTKQLVEKARPLPVTFHRAFDASSDLRKSLEDVVQTGATRILTSGGAPSAPEGLTCLAELVEAARDRIIIMPGSGINASNILRVAQQTRAREFHSGLSTALPHPRADLDCFETEVRKLTHRLSTLTNGPPARGSRSVAD